MNAHVETPTDAEITDWREVIAGPQPEPAAGPRRRQPLSLFHALLIALLLEAGVAYGVSLWLDWKPPHHGGATAPLVAHLVLSIAHAQPASAVHAKGGRNPRIGGDGGEVKAAPRLGAQVSPVGGAGAVSQSDRVAQTRIYAVQAGAQRRPVAAAVRQNGNCPFNGCVQADALHRYERRLHSLLQSRLVAIRPDYPGASPARVTLRFIADPDGGKPRQVALLDVQADAAATRSMLQTVQETLLPPFPRDLGRRALGFKVVLSR